VHALHGLRFADDEPIALETTYFASALTPGLLEQSLSGILLTRRTCTADGRRIEFARDVYRADRASFKVEARIPVPVEDS
jgi:GntR family transcriptional regulator